MESESHSLLSFDHFDSYFPEVKYPCFSIKILNNSGEVEIHRDKKMIKRFKKSDFPPEIDFNNTEHISKLLAIVKAEGCVGLMMQFQLK
jgi:hypothetical protein